VKPLPFAFQPLQPISGRCFEVSQIRRLVHILQFPPRGPAELRCKRLRRLAVLVIEQIFSKSVSKGFDHVPILSRLDNAGKPTFPARGARPELTRADFRDDGIERINSVAARRG
jgi:hypothetical protein